MWGLIAQESVEPWGDVQEDLGGARGSYSPSCAEVGRKVLESQRLCPNYSLKLWILWCGVFGTLRQREFGMEVLVSTWLHSASSVD